VKHLSLRVAVILVISIFLTACGVSGSPTQTSTPDASSALPKLRIGVDTSLPPFETLDPANNEPTGFDIELMKAIAARAGYNVEFVKVNYNQITSVVGQCQIDGGISAIPIMDKLIGQVDFSNPYYTTAQVVVVKAGNITVTGLASLSGSLVGTQMGTLSEIELGKISGVQVEPYETFSFAFQNLIDGYIDAVIADKPRALSYVNIKPNNLKIVGAEFATVQYGIAVCKERTGLVQKFNEALSSLTADGTMKKLAQKWNLGGQ
jgi:polar amino acid transport system substrate-binding protein